jgi:predicted TIM-barrel fold metal-dependent hydrolase
LHGLDHYADIDPLLVHLRDLDMWAQFQVAGDQLEALWPRIERVGVKTMIDHCGRPNLTDGPNAPSLKALWQLADSGLGVIKISGFAKFSAQGFPFEDAHAHVMQVWDAFGPERCIWASDWPHLRGNYRLDHGTLLKLMERWFTPPQLQAMMWDTPAKILGW